MLFADLGADVVRIDRPDARAGADFIMGRGKRSIAIDLKSAQGVEAALSILDKAEALIEGFRPGVMERLGVGPEVALSRNPKLVYGRMTGWGQTGPWSSMAGHDIDYIALTGDSYAQGLGDWLHSLDPLGNGAFGSAHVIHELSGRDVITLGYGGAGSIGSLVMRPLEFLAGVDRRRRLHPRPPDLLIAYFYEGNDLLDTLLELASFSVEERVRGQPGNPDPQALSGFRALFAPACSASISRIRRCVFSRESRSSSLS